MNQIFIFPPGTLVSEWAIAQHMAVSHSLTFLGSEKSLEEAITTAQAHKRGNCSIQVLVVMGEINEKVDFRVTPGEER